MKYEVQIDVVMGIEVQIDAETKAEACQKIKEKQFTLSDLQCHNTWHVANDVVEVVEISDID